ncbi:hypothetical protein SBY92_004785 [Candida maltosa Xu316]
MHHQRMRRFNPNNNLTEDHWNRNHNCNFRCNLNRNRNFNRNNNKLIHCKIQMFTRLNSEK